MEIQKKEISVNIPVCKTSRSVIVDSDAIVSDSKPDLLKIVHIHPRVKLTKTEVLNGKMMITGHIHYTVLYQPENTLGVCNLSFGSDFSHMEENPDFKEGMMCSVSAEAEHIEPELVNSRKIKVKTVINLDMGISSCSPVMLPLAAEGDNLQTKICEFSSLSSFLNKRDIITLNDVLTLPAGKPNISSLLKSDVHLCNKDVKVISGKVIMKGELVISNLYSSEASEGIDFCSHSVPFTEILDAEGLTEDHICTVKTEIEECDFSLATDSDGDVRVINSNVRLGIKISADQSINEQAVCDIYSMTDNLNTTYNSLSVKNLICSPEHEHTLKCSVNPKNASSILSVYNACAKPSVTSVIAGNGKIAVEGYLDTDCLSLTSSDSMPVSSHTEEIPFKFEIPAESCKEGMDADVYIETDQISCILDMSGEINLKIILSCHAKVFENYNIDIVDRAESIGVIESACPSIVLYFVQKGDTLWDIAKRYHTKTEYIMELNSSDCSELKCGSQLLIPRG